MKVGELQLQRNLHEIKPPSVELGAKIQGPEKGAAENQLKFAEVLKSTLERETPLKFSAHALQRLEERQIQLTAVELDRLERGVNDLAAKGGRSSLVLIDNQAYLVSIPNKTVITAMSNLNGEKNVFTNVDSVAIV